mmetsp:Transcript_42573/g.68565  ORF Transcript_42573/g.68565 Transcript_42573/m.68565 type:complete len:235 (+) Transcript_42573:2329-3033(+)
MQLRVAMKHGIASMRRNSLHCGLDPTSKNLPTRETNRNNIKPPPPSVRIMACLLCRCDTHSQANGKTVGTPPDTKKLVTNLNARSILKEDESAERAPKTNVPAQVTTITGFRPNLSPTTPKNTEPVARPTEETMVYVLISTLVKVKTSFSIGRINPAPDASEKSAPHARMAGTKIVAWNLPIPILSSTEFTQASASSFTDNAFSISPLGTIWAPLRCDSILVLFLLTMQYMFSI